MATWIALLRGVNVGGAGKLKMAELTALLEQLGLARVRTYVQSGNVVFEAPGRSPRALATRIGDGVEQRFGFRPHVLVLRADQLSAAAAANPFPDAEAEPKSLHLFFLDRPPSSPDLGALARLKAADETFALEDAIFYLHAPSGVGRSKLAAQAEKKLGVPATARNWRTVTTLIEMAREKG